MLSSAQFQWETVDQSKLHNSEISNAFFFFFVVLHSRVYGKGDLYSRWKYVHACLSVYVWQERSSPTFCNYFSQQIPINPNTQICSMLGGYPFVSSVPICMASLFRACNCAGVLLIRNKFVIKMVFCTIDIILVIISNPIWGITLNLLCTVTCCVGSTDIIFQVLVCRVKHHKREK